MRTRHAHASLWHERGELCLHLLLIVLVSSARALQMQSYLQMLLGAAQHTGSENDCTPAVIRSTRLLKEAEWGGEQAAGCSHEGGPPPSGPDWYLRMVLADGTPAAGRPPSARKDGGGLIRPVLPMEAGATHTPPDELSGNPKRGASEPGLPSAKCTKPSGAPAKSTCSDCGVETAHCGTSAMRQQLRCPGCAGAHGGKTDAVPTLGTARLLGSRSDETATRGVHRDNDDDEDANAEEAKDKQPESANQWACQSCSKSFADVKANRRKCSLATHEHHCQAMAEKQLVGRKRKRPKGHAKGKAKCVPGSLSCALLCRA